MVWVLVSKKYDHLTCRICPYVYYDERTEWYKCKLTKRSVNTCVWDNKRYDKCTIQAVDTPPIPAIDIMKVRHGWWIAEPNCWYRCSECGSHYPSIKGYMDYLYCPKCGVKMDGGQKDV